MGGGEESGGAASLTGVEAILVFFYTYRQSRREPRWRRTPRWVGGRAAASLHPHIIFNRAKPSPNPTNRSVGGSNPTKKGPVEHPQQQRKRRSKSKEKEFSLGAFAYNLAEPFGDPLPSNPSVRCSSCLLGLQNMIVRPIRAQSTPNLAKSISFSHFEPPPCTPTHWSKRVDPFEGRGARRAFSHPGLLVVGCKKQQAQTSERGCCLINARMY